MRLDRTAGYSWLAGCCYSQLYVVCSTHAMPAGFPFALARSSSFLTHVGPAPALYAAPRGQLASKNPRRSFAAPFAVRLVRCAARSLARQLLSDKAAAVPAAASLLAITRSVSQSVSQPPVDSTPATENRV